MKMIRHEYNRQNNISNFSEQSPRLKSSKTNRKRVHPGGMSPARVAPQPIRNKASQSSGLMNKIQNLFDESEDEESKKPGGLDMSYSQMSQSVADNI